MEVPAAVEAHKEIQEDLVAEEEAQAHLEAELLIRVMLVEVLPLPHLMAQVKVVEEQERLEQLFLKEETIEREQMEVAVFQ